MTKNYYKKEREIEDSLLWENYKQYDKAKLISLLKNEKQNKRYAAARELQLRGGKEIIRLAIQLTQDISYKQRAIGAFILGQISLSTDQESDIVKLLCDLSVQDKSAIVRADAVSALGHRCSKNNIHSDIVINSLALTTFDSSVNVRQSTAFALSYLNSESVSPLLLTLLQDENLNVINWAAFAINTLDYDSLEIRDIFFKLLESSNHEIKKEAIIGLAKRRDQRVLPFIKNELKIAIKVGLVYDDTIEAVGLLGDISLLPEMNKILKQFADDDGFIKKTIDRLEKMST
ncbi:hypothetical protein [Neisseria sp. Ec49-e6-T10]|uniref:hypothetical protein n=1 Tax=Neisseria sp. Ec49-e6-T10 TaxID=3140744 RepID=UPI003EBBFB93